MDALNPNRPRVPRALTLARPYEDVSGSLGLGVSLSPDVTYLDIHLYTPLPTARWSLVGIWARLGRPRFTHCTVEVNGTILLDQPLSAPAGWYESARHRLSRPPAASIRLPVSASFEDVERVGQMVEGRRTNWVASAAHQLTGWPRQPTNCATTASLALWGLGVWAVATTPDALWSELCRITGGT